MHANITKNILGRIDKTLKQSKLSCSLVFEFGLGLSDKILPKIILGQMCQMFIFARQRHKILGTIDRRPHLLDMFQSQRAKLSCFDDFFGGLDPNTGYAKYHLIRSGLDMHGEKLTVAYRPRQFGVAL